MYFNYYLVIPDEVYVWERFVRMPLRTYEKFRLVADPVLDMWNIASDCRKVRSGVEWQGFSIFFVFACLQPELSLRDLSPALQVFTTLHRMQTWFSNDNSVHPSVTRVNCDKTEEDVQMFIPYERAFSLVFWEEEWLVEATPSTWNFGLKRNRRFSVDIRS